MAWSPVRRVNAGLVWVEAPGDYATPNFNQLRDGTMAGVVPDWELNGFAAVPEVFTADGRELILRAYSTGMPVKIPDRISTREYTKNIGIHNTTKKMGNCFFVPRCGLGGGRIIGFDIDKTRWTGVFLEEHLNAFVWGNTYQRITVWRVEPNIKYEIGPIGQNTRFLPRDGSKMQRYLPWPSGSGGYFRQVRILDEYLEWAITEVDDFAVVSPLSRAMGNS